MAPNQKYIVGDCRDSLKGLPSDSIDCLVTSPPYWGLRDYKTEPLIWDGSPDCEHEWSGYLWRGKTGGTDSEKVRTKSTENYSAFGNSKPDFCSKCGAWRGQLGLEPDPNLYIKHLCDIFDEVKRVLKPSGTCWVNLGDTYAGSGGAGGDYNPGGLREGQPRFKQGEVIDVPDKCLVQIPSRFALEMTSRGWILRNEIIWCLDESTKILVKVNGSLNNLTISEIKGLDQAESLEVLSNDICGKATWIRIMNVFDNGMAETLKITTKTGREIICTPNHKFVYKSTNLVPNDFLKLKTSEAKNLKIGDSLIVNDEIKTGLPLGDCNDFCDGFAVGFYLAEGSWLKNKIGVYKDNELSKYAQVRWGRSDLELRKVGIQLSCGRNDLERGSIPLIQSKYQLNVYEYDNSVIVTSRDKELLKTISENVIGNDSHDKRLTPSALNRSIMFLNGILHGFISGDGCYDRDNNRWRIGICNNKMLRDDIALICRMVGASFRFESSCPNILNGKSFEKQTMSVRIDDGKKRKTLNGNICDPIESIEPNGMSHVFDLEVEPIYTTHCGKGTTGRPSTDKRKTKFNNLYFLANGVWTHNCKPNCMPSSVTDRFTVDFEKVFFFVKSKRYYFKQQTEPLKIIGVEGIKFGGNKASGYGNPSYSGNEYNSDKMTNGRNKRTVWTISTKPYSGSHFAVFPIDLIAPMIDAGCPKQICSKCGHIREPIIEKVGEEQVHWAPGTQEKAIDANGKHGSSSVINTGKIAIKGVQGWTDCGCNAGWEPGTVLDIFSGSGTVLEYARKNGLNGIGFDVNPNYKALAEERAMLNIKHITSYEDEPEDVD